MGIKRREENIILGLLSYFIDSQKSYILINLGNIFFLHQLTFSLCKIFYLFQGDTEETVLLQRFYEDFEWLHHCLTTQNDISGLIVSFISYVVINFLDTDSPGPFVIHMTLQGETSNSHSCQISLQGDPVTQYLAQHSIDKLLSFILRWRYLLYFI